jgi:hypothetical protein
MTGDLDLPRDKKEQEEVGEAIEVVSVLADNIHLEEGMSACCK